MHGDRSALAVQLGRLIADGYAVTICVAARGAADRMIDLLADEGVVASIEQDDDALRSRGCTCLSPSSTRDSSFTIPRWRFSPSTT